MSQTTIEILDRLTSFWPSADERMAKRNKTITQPDEKPVVVTTTYTKDGVELSNSVVEMPPDVSFYRYVKGTATADDGSIHEYTHRFESDPASDDAKQQIESADCQALVQAELDRWLETKLPPGAEPPTPDAPVVAEPAPSDPVVPDQPTEASAALNLLNNTNPQ